QPAQYESTATILLNPSVPSALVPYLQTEVASGLADSYAEYMRSRSFGQSVVKELKFAATPEEVVGSISTYLKPNTLFFKIGGRSDSPEHSQELANTVVRVFISANTAQQQAQSNQGPGSVNNEMHTRLNDKLAYLGEEIKSYQDQLKQLDAQPVSKERNDLQLQLRGQLVALQQTETDTIVALGRLDEASVPLNTAVIIDPAQLGSRVATKLNSNVLAAGVASFILGIVLAFLLDYLDYTVRSPEYLEQVLGLTPMAVVGRINGDGGGNGKRRRRRGRSTGAPLPASVSAAATGRLVGHKLVTLEFPKSPDSESFRVLRTNIQFSSLDKAIRTLVVTSGGPGEGKSFTAANLAIVMAQAGKRVILVDTDLRRPSIHKLFSLPNTVGFTNMVLNDLGEKGGAIQTVPEVANLLVVTSGPLPPNPSEILDSHQAAHVMTQLSQCADLVIYDTPPVTAVTDPAIIATRVDAVVFVVNAGVTRRDTVARVKKILENVGVKSLITVLNRVELDNINGYYYYYHSSYGTVPDAPLVETNGRGKNGTSNGNGHGANGAYAANGNGNGNGQYPVVVQNLSVDQLMEPRQKD
ncbi:MAG TPA: polysaccharide biosynthesis tyrosine autokinase, partial [Chloroflexia bacterium]|nr:polysaccharide biosynthesis tyrosine autokinase [Chloroflexia bacterium]